MSKLRSLPYAVLTMGLLAAGSASAQSMWSIDQREASQQQPINEGRRDGSLTRSEANRLQQGDSRIDRYEAPARSDGVVTQGDRQRLDGMLDRQSQAIHRERTDGHRAGGNDRGNHNGWDGNRSNYLGGDNNRGNHNGWDHASTNHNGWGDSDRNRGGVNRPEHSTHNGQQQAPSGTNNPHGGFNGHGQNTGPQPANTHTSPSTSHNQGARAIQASAPVSRTATSTTTMNSTNNGSRNNRR